MEVRDKILQAMNGRWRELLGKYMPAEHLTGKHCGCPFCGGKDRFRAFGDFEETGGTVCNQCGKNANGIDTLMKARKVEFKDALDELQQLTGIKSEKRISSVTSKEAVKYVRLQWAAFVPLFEAKNKGCTELGLQRAGAMLCNVSYDSNVFAIPTINQQLDVVKSCVLLSAHSKHLLTRDGNKIRHRTMAGHKYSELLICSPASLKALQDGTAKLVVRVEGVTSYLALLSSIPDEVWDSGTVAVFSNPAGAGQIPTWAPKWIASSVRDANILTLGDSDKPGLRSMETWAARMAQCNFTNRVHACSFGVNGDKDLRDWLNEDDTDWSLLKPYVERNGRIVEPDRDKPEGESDSDRIDDAFDVLKSFGLKMIGQDQKAIHVYSVELEKKAEFPHRSTITERDLLRSVHPRYASRVGDSDERQELVKSIAIASAVCPIAVEELKPFGMWGDAVCQRGHLFVLEGTGLVEQPSMSHNRQTFAIGSRNWFDVESLRGQLEMDDDYFRQIYDRLAEVVDIWTWQDNDIARALLPPLLLASVNPSCFEFRPHVMITARSNSGKTRFGQIFFDDKADCILPNSKMTGTLSKAGLRGELNDKQGPILLDEFDTNRHNRAILEMLRQSSRGQPELISVRGLHNLEFSFCHLVFMSGIHDVSGGEADDNRLLKFAMKDGRHSYRDFQRQLPSRLERNELRSAVVAMALKYVPLAARMVDETVANLQEHAGGLCGPHKRLLESLAIPIAVRLAVLGGKPSDMKPSHYESLVDGYLQSIGGIGVGGGIVSDSEEFFENLCASEVRKSGRSRTVGALLAAQSRACADAHDFQREGDADIDNYQRTHPQLDWFEQMFAQYGVGIIQPRSTGNGAPKATPIEHQQIFARATTLAKAMNAPSAKVKATLKTIDGSIWKKKVYAFGDCFSAYVLSPDSILGREASSEITF